MSHSKAQKSSAASRYNAMQGSSANSRKPPEFKPEAGSPTLQAQNKGMIDDWKANNPGTVEFINFPDHILRQKIAVIPEDGDHAITPTNGHAYRTNADGFWTDESDQWFKIGNGRRGVISYNPRGEGRNFFRPTSHVYSHPLGNLSDFGWTGDNHSVSNPFR